MQRFSVMTSMRYRRKHPEITYKLNPGHQHPRNLDMLPGVQIHWKLTGSDNDHTYSTAAQTRPDTFAANRAHVTVSLSSLRPRVQLADDHCALFLH